MPPSTWYRHRRETQDEGGGAGSARRGPPAAEPIARSGEDAAPCGVPASSDGASAESSGDGRGEEGLEDEDRRRWTSSGANGVNLSVALFKKNIDIFVAFDFILRNRLPRAAVAEYLRQRSSLVTLRTEARLQQFVDATCGCAHRWGRLLPQQVLGVHRRLCRSHHLSGMQFSASPAKRQSCSAGRLLALVFVAQGTVG